MHEVSIAEEMLEIIHKRASEEGIQKVIAINLKIGEYSGVFPDSLKFAFEVLSKGKITEGANLNIEMVSPSFSCQKCKRIINLDNDRCPHCGSEEIKVSGGNELQILSFEGD